MVSTGDCGSLNPSSNLGLRPEILFFLFAKSAKTRGFCLSHKPVGLCSRNESHSTQKKEKRKGPLPPKERIAFSSTFLSTFAPSSSTKVLVRSWSSGMISAFQADGPGSITALFLLAKKKLRHPQKKKWVRKSRRPH